MVENFSIIEVSITVQKTLILNPENSAFIDWPELHKLQEQNQTHPCIHYFSDHGGYLGKMALTPGYCLSPRQFGWRNCCHRCNGSDEKMQMLLSGFSAKSFFNPWKLRRRAIHCSELDNSHSSTAPEEVSEGTTVSSAQSQLELLDLLTSSSSISEDEISNRVKSARTIREQLKSLVTEDDVEEIKIPLGKRFRAPTYDLLTTSQKRNIRRQNYLNQVGERNDTTLFTGIALLVILPPAVILGVAIATGYVDLLP